MPIDINSMIIEESMSVVKAMSVIDEIGRGIAFICRGELLKATLTDGDIRRHILKNGSLDVSVDQVGNYSCKFLLQKDINQAEIYMKENSIRSLPIIDEMGKLLSVQFLNFEPLYREMVLDIPVVIQAGGIGTRLYPYTKILPKPLIPIGERPITELIMDRFLKFGCNDFTLIVNYKKNMIKAYFSDELDCKYKISFVDEDIPLGTGGGLALLKNKIGSTFFMTNCDALISEDYSKIYEHHKLGGYILTMLCATKHIEIPYGTVQLGGGGEIISLSEKPSFSFLTNTGFYIIEPNFLQYIPDNTFIHITDIIDECIKNGEKIGMFPISESQWSDMGQMEEMDKMRKREGL